jgi:hypothetical protein
MVVADTSYNSTLFRIRWNVQKWISSSIPRRFTSTGSVTVLDLSFLAWNDSSDRRRRLEEVGGSDWRHCCNLEGSLLQYQCEWYKDMNINFLFVRSNMRQWEITYYMPQKIGRQVQIVSSWDFLHGFWLSGHCTFAIMNSHASKMRIPKWYHHSHVIVVRYHGRRRHFLASRFRRRVPEWNEVMSSNHTREWHDLRRKKESCVIVFQKIYCTY